MKKNNLKTELGNFLNSHYSDEVAEAKSKGNPLEISVDKLDRYNPDIVDMMEKEPQKAFKTTEEVLDNKSIDEFLLVDVPDIYFKRIRDLRAEHLNEFIKTKGLIKRASGVKPQIKSAIFECRSCGNRVEKEQNSSKLKSPYRCACGSRKFDVEEKKFRNVQTILIEETNENLEGSEQPDSIPVIVSGSLVDPEFQKKISPGNKVDIVGVVKGSPAKKKSMKYEYFITANNVIPTEVVFEEIDITEEDEERIEKISDQENVIDVFADSIASSIYGMDEIKRALALQLFGGVKREREDGSEVRGDIHILLIGEPGTSKTRLTRYISKLAPKGRYLSGGSTTTTGATASVVKDEEGNWVIEAGAMVLSDGGVLCLDEIDLIDEADLKKLNEALETQQLSISKATVNATLRTETTLLASGNPKFDRFDPYQPIAEQIEIMDSLLNRFDLLFPIKDVPDEERDSKIADHILGDAEHENVLDQDIVRKYIAHSKNIRPDHTEESKEKLKNFYCSLRNKYDSVENREGESPIPITARQLESLMRLSEASARMRLSEKVEARDVDLVVNIMKYFLKEVGMDPETGKFDIDMVQSGVSSSKRNKMRSVLKIVKDFEKDMDKVPVEDVIAEAEEVGISDPDKLLDRLISREGELFKPDKGHVKTV